MPGKIPIEQAHKIFPTADEISSGLKKAAGEATRYAHSQVPGYPSPPQNSTYRRTGTLGRLIGTTVESIGNSHAGILGSPTVYAPYVIGPDRDDALIRQARIHQNRWYTLEGVMEKSTDKVKEIYNKLVKKLFRGV